jgi:hypothetical protein
MQTYHPPITLLVIPLTVDDELGLAELLGSALADVTLSGASAGAVASETKDNVQITIVRNNALLSIFFMAVECIQ